MMKKEIVFLLLFITLSCTRTDIVPPSVAGASSSAKAITSFVLSGLTPAVTATINETTKTITATLPSGTVLSNLKPTILISTNATISPNTGVVQNFSSPVSYTVKAQDGSTQVYVVTITTANTTGKSSEKAITSFVFNGLTPAVTGTINGTAIAITVPVGTSLTALVPTIAISSKASISPNTGVAQSFASPVKYTVTAEDATTQEYTVTVTAGTITKSSEKAILTFGFNALSPIVTATIDEAAKTIKATVPTGTSLTALIPTLTLSSKATVSPVTNVAQDFSSNKTYTVTAEDGSTQAYIVTVTAATSSVTAFEHATMKPWFDTYCGSCHLADKSNAADWLYDPNNYTTSIKDYAALLFKEVYTAKSMPVGVTLSTTELAKFKTWADAGYPAK